MNENERPSESSSIWWAVPIIFIGAVPIILVYLRLYFSG